MIYAECSYISTMLLTFDICRWYFKIEMFILSKLIMVVKISCTFFCVVSTLDVRYVARWRDYINDFLYAEVIFLLILI